MLLSIPAPRFYIRAQFVALEDYKTNIVALEDNIAMNQFTSNFCEYISDYISSNNITVIEFAKLIGCRDSCVIKWLNGYNQPSLEYVVIVADKLDVSVDYMIGLSNDPIKPGKHSNDTFSERLGKLIESKKVSKNKLAACCGTTSSTVSKWLLHGQLPKPDIAVRLSEFFDCSLDYLLARTDCM